MHVFLVIIIIIISTLSRRVKTLSVHVHGFSEKYYLNKHIGIVKNIVYN